MLMHLCPKCNRVFNRGTHMRNHLKTHNEQRFKAICSVGNCNNKYSDVKAWTVHFNSCHNEQKNHFNKYKNELKFVELGNAGNVNQTVEKLLLEIAQLKAQIQKNLKIRCAAKLRKRSLKQIHKSARTKLLAE